MGSLPLSGIRVVDISSFLAAPMVAMFLGDYGADVVKVEHPTKDPTHPDQDSERWQKHTSATPTSRDTRIGPHCYRVLDWPTPPLVSPAHF